MFADLPTSISHGPVYIQTSVSLYVSICLQTCLWPDVCGHGHVQMFVGLCPDVSKSVCPDFCRPVCPRLWVCASIYCFKSSNVETVAKWWLKKICIIQYHLNTYGLKMIPSLAQIKQKWITGCEGIKKKMTCKVQSACTAPACSCVCQTYLTTEPI